VQRTSIYSAVKSVIKYGVATLNIGGAMNLDTSVFTAPTKGRYYFSFSAQSYESGNNLVYIRVNKQAIGSTHSFSKADSMSLSVTLNLNIGDNVDTYLDDGSLWSYDCSWQCHILFTGVLLEEDLSF